MDGLDSSCTPIFAGQLWAMPKPGPWKGYGPTVEILDVRDGWVRYAGFPGDDSRREERDFRESFQWVGDGQPEEHRP